VVDFLRDRLFASEMIACAAAKRIGLAHDAMSRPEIRIASKTIAFCSSVTGTRRSFAFRSLSALGGLPRAMRIIIALEFQEGRLVAAPCPAMGSELSSEADNGARDSRNSEDFLVNRDLAANPSIYYLRRCAVWCLLCELVLRSCRWCDLLGWDDSVLGNRMGKPSNPEGMG